MVGKKNILDKQPCTTTSHQNKSGVSRPDTLSIQTKLIPSLIQRKAKGSYTANEALTSQINATRGSSSSLPDHTRSFMESRIGADFSGVRIHTGSEAVQMNRELNAHVYDRWLNAIGRYWNGKFTLTNGLRTYRVAFVPLFLSEPY